MSPTHRKIRRLFILGLVAAGLLAGLGDAIAANAVAGSQASNIIIDAPIWGIKHTKPKGLAALNKPNAAAIWGIKHT